jgi:hypothetical protein
LKIIFTGLKENLLNQIIINDNLDIFMQNNYFNNLIISFFDRIDFKSNIKLAIGANNITIYNGLQIPQSKSFLDKVIKYIDDEICNRFIENENLLRKNYEEAREIFEITEEHSSHMKRFENNILVELNNYDFFKEIYNQTNDKIKKLMREDYLRYYAIKIIEKKQIKDYTVNENTSKILLLLIKIKLGENGRLKNFNFNYYDDMNEFVKIMLFMQGYKEDILNIIDTILEINNYFDIETKMINILDKNIIKYEESKLNLNKAKDKFYQSTNIAEISIRQAIELSNKGKNKENSNAINNTCV